MPDFGEEDHTEEGAGQEGRTARTAVSVRDTRTAGGERVDREGLRTEGNWVGCHQVEVLGGEEPRRTLLADPVLSPLSCLCPGFCRARSTMDCSCVSDLLFAPPALPALWTPGNRPVHPHSPF